jgi:alpha-L-fucosidase
MTGIESLVTSAATSAEHSMNKSLSTLALFAILCSASSGATPASISPTPSSAQLKWQENDFALFLRLGLNTFTGQEQGTGTEDPGLFNPTKLDVKQWVRVARDCGAKRIILQVKGHEGFCLWPSRFSEYSVKQSPWRSGHGDVVRDFASACREAGLDAGFYLACEDRHDPAFGRPAYNETYQNELAELLAYGRWNEVRFDNAGGEGEGAYGSIGIAAKDRRQLYQWTDFFATVHTAQRNVILVSAAGPGARWNGNNNGHVGEPNWAPFDLRSIPGPEPEDRKQLNVLNFGDPNGKVWLPCECCVSLRPHWFWRDDDQPMPLDRLFSTYCKSVGRGAVLLLSVPINRDGLIADPDASRLRELHEHVDNFFKIDIAAGKPALNLGATSPTNFGGTSSTTPTNFGGTSSTSPTNFGGTSSTSPTNAADNRPETYWAADENVTNDCGIEVNLGSPTTFSASACREPIQLGQRVAAYRIEYLDHDQWKLAVHGTTIGRLKIERFKPVTTSKVRLVIEQSRARPLISRFSLYP